MGAFQPAVQGQFTLDREPPGPSTRKTGLVITEIMYNPRAIPGWNTNQTLEFIELFNSKPWAEDLSGFSIGGSVNFTFPANTVLEPGAYLVVARVPELILSEYGVTNVVGPWDGAETNRLSTEEGVVQLLNRQGAVLLTVNYQDSPPWSEAADGTGHSLSLVRPSYGEDDYRAWAESDSVGGSPGTAEPLSLDPLASVLINEWQNHSDPVDWIELYNRSNNSVDLSGAWLSDDPTTNKFRIPNGTTIPARGFVSWDQNQLGFELFAGGETIFFVNSNQTRVIDVIDFRGQSNNITSGRFPDGGPVQYGLSNGTRNNPNAAPMRYPVVINEIMYNPISGSVDDEYIELYNRGNLPVNVAGWEFVTGINFYFPTNPLTMAMPPGAHWVIARNPTNLMSIYSNLTTNNTFGPYTGSLANGGERVVFTAADYDNVNNGGTITVEKLPVPVSDLTYGDGGKWGQWSDGLGSSLELIDPEADEHFPSNWADSNDTGESAWTAIEYNGPLGETLGTPVNDSVIIMLQGIGECLVDEIEVRVEGGANRVINGGFESGLDSWSLQGSHDFSTIENDSFAGTKCLHLRAGSRGDNQSNRILSAPFDSPIPPDATNVSIRAKVRWLRGHPELLVRLHGSATEAYGRLSLPRRLGTPGMANSRKIPNAGPAVSRVTHSPVLPEAGQPVIITASAIDRQTVTSLAVRYRVDPSETYLDLPMVDTGLGGDAVQGDGLFTATIPAQAAGTMVAFYVEARDSLGAIGTFPQDVFPPAVMTRCWPTDALRRECVVRWGEVQMPGDFATYHLWVSSVNSNRWHTRDTQNNTPMDGTFVYNNRRVVYNALPLFSGSPWHRTNAITGPAGANRVDYEMNFPDDEPLLGSTDFVLNNPGNPDILTISDLSAVAEQTVYKIFEGLGMPHNHRRYIHLFVNGSQRSTAYERPGNFIFEDSQQPNGDMIAQWFPNDAGGQLFKVEDWFEFDRNGFDIRANNDADLARRTITLNGLETFVPAPYRFMFRKRSIGVGNSANDYSAIFTLINAVSPAENPTGTTVDPDLVGAEVNWEAWMRHFAVQRAVGNWDSYGWERGKNDYLYRTAAGFVHMPWDIDYSLGLGRPPTEPLFASNDPRISAMFNTPAIVRAYWRAFADLVNGPFRNEVLDPFIDSRIAALTANNINPDLDAAANIKSYISERRAFLQSQLATVQTTFALQGETTFSTDNNLLVVNGTAPIEVKFILVNGIPYPVTFTSATTFQLRLVLEPGDNAFEIQGLDRFNQPIAGLVSSMLVTYTGPLPNPAGALVISEVMYNAITPAAQFVEIQNLSTQNFDLSGWRLDGANLTFPAGAIITNGQTIVLARDRSAFFGAYGSVPLFALLPNNLSAQGQLLALIQPTETNEWVIDAIRYEPRAPWPTPATGESLQLVDRTLDNSRASNWAVDPADLATPGGENSVATSRPPYDPLWLNEVQVLSLVGPNDNNNEAEPWLELLNAGDTAINLDGYFLADNFASNLTALPFPAGITLAAGERRLVWLDGEASETTATHLHLDRRLQSGDKLALVRLIEGQPQVTDHLTLPELGANVSYGSYPEGQPVYRTRLFSPTPGQTNTAPVIPLFINEWMARNTAGPRDPADSTAEDWFEIYNGGNVTVDLGGYFLSDNPANLVKFTVPDNGRYRIAPGGFLIVWADGSPNQNSATRPDLHVDFQLGGSSGFIALTAPDGVTVVDFISYGPQGTDISEGRYSDGAASRQFTARYTPGGPNAHPTINTPPAFPVLADRFATPGQTVLVTIRATDPDVFRVNDTNLPPQILTYSIDLGPTNGDSRVNQGGSYRWIIPSSQTPGIYPVKLRVVDNGTPQGVDTVTFNINVLSIGTVIVDAPQPRIYTVYSAGGQATFSIGTTPGRTYRVQYTDDLGSGEWDPLGRDFVAANESASLTDPLSSPQRFYRVLQLD